MNKTAKQQGFTLIELIMVIVLLGILSVFAVPRFVNLQAEAQEASLGGVLGAVRSAAAIAHAQYLIAGDTPATITMAGATVALAHGYPTAGSIHIAASLGSTAIADDDDLDVDGGVNIAVNATGTAAVFTLGNCSFTYVPAADANTPPVIGDVSCT